MPTPRPTGARAHRSARRSRPIAGRPTRRRGPAVAGSDARRGRGHVRRLEPESVPETLRDLHVSDEAFDGSHVAGGPLQEQAPRARDALDDALGGTGIVGADELVVRPEDRRVARVVDEDRHRGPVDPLDPNDAHRGVCVPVRIRAGHRPAVRQAEIAVDADRAVASAHGHADGLEPRQRTRRGVHGPRRQARHVRLHVFVAFPSVALLRHRTGVTVGADREHPVRPHAGRS